MSRKAAAAAHRFCLESIVVEHDQAAGKSRKRSQMSIAVRVNNTDAGNRTRLRILVRGAVQGVGFRPFVYRRAIRLGLAGWVLNSNEGVLAEAEGDPARIAALVRTIGQTPPVNATVDAIETASLPLRGAHGFEIRASDVADRPVARVLTDIATRPDCFRELFDPAGRRYRLPVINCTHCGSRYSIIETILYDRAQTSMRRFAMCPTCRAEYDNPADRGFHAELNACPACGPHIELWNAVGTVVCRDEEALLTAAAALRAGANVAVKGDWRISSCCRCPRRGGRQPAAGAQAARGKALRRDVSRFGGGCRALLRRAR
jgi:hydrogenase maturation protein HypF